jgi:hypothetical protein
MPASTLQGHQNVPSCFYPAEPSVKQISSKKKQNSATINQPMLPLTIPVFHKEESNCQLPP